MKFNFIQHIINTSIAKNHRDIVFPDITLEIFEPIFIENKDSICLFNLKAVVTTNTREPVFNIKNVKKMNVVSASLDCSSNNSDSVFKIENVKNFELQSSSIKNVENHSAVVKTDELVSVNSLIIRNNIFTGKGHVSKN